MAAEPSGGWKTPKLPALVGAKEACLILDVQKMTLSRWLKPGSGPHGEDGTYFIPPCPASPASGPVWAKSDVEHFAKEQGRRRAPATAAT